MSSDKARQVRRKGHEMAKKFASRIGVAKDYQNNPQAKKDVIDRSGDAHSVKSGEKWQIFLYRESRLAEDAGFEAMNGIGQALLECIRVFPKDIEMYRKNREVKHRYKKALEPKMIAAKNLISKRLKPFLHKAIFNAGEVTYLTIYVNEQHGFCVFHYEDVLDVLSQQISVENSQARTSKQYSNQKVLFRIDGVNAGELEIRNDSQQHYKEMKLRFIAEKITPVLRENIAPHESLFTDIHVHGKAIKTFLRKHKSA